MDFRFDAVKRKKAFEENVRVSDNEINNFFISRG